MTTYSDDIAKICFVTDEVMPFTKGGIGAFIRNMIGAYSRESDIAILFTGTRKIAAKEWNEKYPNIALYQLNTYSEEKNSSKFLWEQQHPRHHFLQKSFRIFEKLTELTNMRVDFDVIEFLDWGSPAFYSIQAKNCGLWQTKAKLAVRIHCPESVLRNFEFREPSNVYNLIFDIERKCLSDCDIVVASLGPVANYIANFFGFDNDWRKSVLIEAPPVHVEKKAEYVTPISSMTSIVFSSKIQSIKRPKVFLLGSLFYLSEQPNFLGDIVFAAFTADSSAVERLRDAIPDRFANRVRFEDDLTTAKRDALVSKSIVVFPNVFEAFCFAAYEACLSGAIVILNGKNPAFGDLSPWEDGVNCFKFDGTTSGLARSLERANSDDAKKLSLIASVHPRNPYWVHQLSPITDDSNHLEAKLALTAFVLHRNQPVGLEETISSLKSEIIDIKIVIVDDASTDEDSLIYLNSLQEGGDSDIEMHRSAIKVGWSSLINHLIPNISTDFTCIIPAGTVFTLGSISMFVGSLAKQPLYDLLLPASALSSSDAAYRPSFIFHPIGECLASGWTNNFYAAHFFVARTSVLKAYQFHESVESNVTWPYLRQIALYGHRMMVWPLVDVLYRDRFVSMFETYLDHELAFNLDLTGKLGRFLPPAGLAIDSCDLIKNRPVNAKNETENPLSVEERRELELRRKFGKRAPHKPPMIDLISSKFRSGKIKARQHVDRMSSSGEQAIDKTAELGTALTVVGWAFAETPNEVLPASIILRQGDKRIEPTRIVRFARLDVALTFNFDADTLVGYECMFDTAIMTSGDAQLVCIYEVVRDKVIQKEVASIKLL